MPGGLLNIISVGNANLILTGNPKKTFFKTNDPEMSTCDICFTRMCFFINFGLVLRLVARHAVSIRMHLHLVVVQ